MTVDELIVHATGARPDAKLVCQMIKDKVVELNRAVLLAHSMGVEVVIVDEHVQFKNGQGWFRTEPYPRFTTHLTKTETL